MRFQTLFSTVLVSIVLALFFGAFSSVSWAQDTTREHYARADITVTFAKDGSVKVREELDYVKARGVTTRGIFRELPTKVREGAITHRKNFKLTLATRNGEREAVTNMSDSGTIIWRLGRSNVLLNEGVQKYVLEYETNDDWIYRYADLDEIRWNVWDQFHTIPVKNFTSRIILPEGATAKQTAAYSGAFGRADNDVTITENGNVIEFTANNPMSPGEAVTASVGVEKGVFDPLSAAEISARWWRANGALVGLCLITPGVLGFYFLNWSRVGRDPVQPPVFARYEAPKNYSAAAAHRIVNKGLKGDSALISTLLSLAIKKRLEISVTKKQTTLRPLSRSSYADVLLNTEENLLFNKLFGGNMTDVILRKQTPNSRFHSVTQMFKNHLNAAYSRAYRKVNGKYVVMGIVLTLFGLFAVFSAFSTPSSLLFWGLIAGLILVNILFMFLMPAPTKKGAQITSEIEGFKLYLETAEKLRLNSAEVGTDRVPPMTVERYEAFLPYAVALDVEKPWTKHFEKTLPVVAENYNPGYYNSYRSGGFSSGGVRDIQRDMVKSLSSGVASARPIQTSSSGGSSSSGRSFSGGGGFSGGGSGGGGSGSW